MENPKLGIAFIRGLNMFGKRNISESQLRKVLKDIERENHKAVKFVGIYGRHKDIIVFKKTGVHYATVGYWIESKLANLLGEKVCVTTRSLKVVKGVVDRF